MSKRLEEHPLPGLVQELHAGRATGVLRIEARVGRHELYVRDGLPVAVYLPGSAELLGNVLKDMGLIDDATHKRTLAAPPPVGKRYGDWLIEQGLVSPDKLRLALKAQVRRKLHRLFFLTEGEFTFEAQVHEEGVHMGESTTVQPARAIYQGVRSAWTAERLAQTLTPLDDRAVRCTASPDVLARYGLGQTDGRAAELLTRGWWRLPDLVASSGLPAQPVHALVYSLYVTGTLEVRHASEVQLLRSAADAGPLPALSPDAARTGSDPGFVFGASTPTKSTPPLRSPTPTNPNLRASMMQSNPASRSHPSLTPGRHATDPALRASQPPKSATGENSLDQLQAQIVLKAKVVEAENLFEVLGVSEDATAEQVKTAYFEAAKRYHPDRLQTLGLEALKESVEKIFRRVGEAYGTVFDDKQRQDYRAQLGRSRTADPEAHAQAMKIVEAEMAMRRGESYLKRNDYKQALRELEQAVAGNPQEGEHVALLAFARVCAGQLSWGDAKTQLQAATRLSPKCARAYYYLGLAYKETNEMDRAALQFKRAIEHDPRLLDAERELRLRHMRKEKDEKKGLFDRFRKKP